MRIIDRLNIVGPAKHVAWLSARIGADEFESSLISRVMPPGEGDMSYFARGAGVEPLIINKMCREIGPRNALVFA